MLQTKPSTQVLKGSGCTSKRTDCSTLLIIYHTMLQGFLALGAPSLKVCRGQMDNCQADNSAEQIYGALQDMADG